MAATRSGAPLSHEPAHPTIADAVLDRLVHNAHKLKMKGPSRRKEKAQAKA